MLDRCLRTMQDEAGEARFYSLDAREQSRLPESRESCNDKLKTLDDLPVSTAERVQGCPGHQDIRCHDRNSVKGEAVHNPQAGGRCLRPAQGSGTAKEIGTGKNGGREPSDDIEHAIWIEAREAKSLGIEVKAVISGCGPPKIQCRTARAEIPAGVGDPGARSAFREVPSGPEISQRGSSGAAVPHLADHCREGAARVDRARPGGAHRRFGYLRAPSGTLRAGGTVVRAAHTRPRPTPRSSSRSAGESPPRPKPCAMPCSGATRHRALSRPTNRPWHSVNSMSAGVRRECSSRHWSMGQRPGKPTSPL